MANILDRFNNSVIGSKGKIADYTSTISSKGDFKRVVDINAIILSWNNILLTPTRSYDWDPEFGCDLYKMIFEPADDLTIEKIKDEIINKLQRYDDRATIADIDVVFLSNMKGLSIKLNVEYKGEESEFHIVVDEILYSKFLEAA